MMGADRHADIEALAEDISGMQQFFGCALSLINPAIIRIYLRHRPEWIKGCTSISNLPKWDSSCQYLVSVPKKISLIEMADRIVWIVENLSGGWYVAVEGFYFSLESDAVHYKLRWH